MDAPTRVKMPVSPAAIAAAVQDVPALGQGCTPERLGRLAALGQSDLSLARLAEAHLDAVSIFTEAGQAPQPDFIYGVWAADTPRGSLRAQRWGPQWSLTGFKNFCSGTTIVDAALVTAHADGSVLLFEIPLHAAGVRVESSSWASAGLADTATGRVSFADVVLDSTAQIGGAGWYLERPGFWGGAIGPAACWAGGAQALIGTALEHVSEDPHSRAQCGALRALNWNLETVLNAVGREIDADPQDCAGSGRRRALIVRHLVERMCMEVLDRFGRVTGTEALIFNAMAAEQHAALTLYIRQCHAERDLEQV